MLFLETHTDGYRGAWRGRCNVNRVGLYRGVTCCSFPLLHLLENFQNKKLKKTPKGMNEKRRGIDFGVKLL